MKTIDLGYRKIGLNYPAYIVAEIGINYNGDLDIAKKTILAAKEAGADSVKFQNYKTEDFVPSKNLEYEYISQGLKIRENQYDMFKKYELHEEMLFEIKNFCDSINIDFHSTPTNKNGVDLLKKIGVKIIKNGSDYLTNLELVEYMCKCGLPTVLSTGMAFVSEIDEAVRIFKNNNNEQLILLHCTSQYPTPITDVHLRKIKTLRDTFGVLSGFSDHSEGAWAACGAIAFNAVWIEKHFTLDKNLPGPDHHFSMNPKELKQLVEAIRSIESALGTAHLGPTKNELDSRENYRLSCSAANDLIKGHIITEKDLSYLRPGKGIKPKDNIFLLNRKLIRDLKKGEAINLNDLE